jgi:GNAT superfamily N-acetyltransferase
MTASGFAIMETDIIIRQARPGDIAGMCELLEDLFTIESGFSPDIEKQARGLGLLLTASVGSSFVAVATRGNVVIGMGSVQVVVSTAEGGLAGLVEDIIVHKDFRGTGVGSKLLARIALWASQNGITRLQLLAAVDNMRALDFYEHRGWNRTGLTCLRKLL